MDDSQPMSLFDGNEMNAIERNELVNYEAVIERGLTTFLEVGNALMEIRARQLYKEYGTWARYCEERWGIVRRHADRLILAAEVVENLGPIGPILPINELHARPLTRLEPEQQRQAWAKIVETAPGGKISHTHIQNIVDELRQEHAGNEEESEEPEAYNIEDSFGHVETVLIKPSKLAIHYSSDTPEHYTPAEILDAVVACLGAIDLDPCSNSHESPNVPATHHFTAADDGLSQFWHGKVFMNPPYGREIAKWVDKLCAEYEAERMTEAIVLVPARTDTDWWEQLVDDHKLICFVHGRLTFIGNEEVAPFPSALVYFGAECDRFYYAFRSFGRIMQELNPDMFGA